MLIISKFAEFYYSYQKVIHIFSRYLYNKSYHLLLNEIHSSVSFYLYPLFTFLKSYGTYLNKISSSRLLISFLILVGTEHFNHKYDAFWKTLYLCFPSTMIYNITPVIYNFHMYVDLSLFSQFYSTDLFVYHHDNVKYY